MGTVLEADGRQGLVDLLSFFRCRRPQERWEHALARPFEREIEIFPYGQIRIDRGGLKFSADAEFDDFVLTLADELLILAEDDPARHGLRLSADDIEQRRLAGSVRPDHDPELV